MVQKNQLAADDIARPKKLRVGFTDADSGAEPSECIQIYLVSCIEQVGAPDAPRIDPIDLNAFFDDDGKIYGYQELKITILVSSISFHAYADISFQSSCDKGKGITDLKSAFQKIFGENLVAKKEDFLQFFSSESHYIKSVVSHGEIVLQRGSTGYKSNSNGHSDAEADNLEVICMIGGNVHFGHLYSRLVPLVLLLIDGSNPIDVSDPKWELYVLIQKSPGPEKSIQYLLLGFAAIYRFYHYPDGFRLRLSQIVVLPPYQAKGHGRRLLEALNNVAASDDVYDLTVEEPLDRLQLIRTCIDTLCLFAFKPVQDAVDSAVSRLKHGKLSRFRPPPDLIEDVRKNFKINRKQFSNCWEILLHPALQGTNEFMENYKAFVSDHVKAEIMGTGSESKGKQVVEVASEYDEDVSFVMFRTRTGGEGGGVKLDDSGALRVQQVIDERLEEIKQIAEKVSGYVATAS